MDYIGSKKKLVSWLFGIIANKGNPSHEIFLDACSGSGAVTRAAVIAGYKQVIANDLLSFPAIVAEGSISLPATVLPAARAHLIKMNNLKGRKGFFFNNYSVFAKRPYFSDANAKKLDAARQYIDKISDPLLQAYLLYCSLEALSAVSNTTGVQAAFLKKLKERAKNPIVFKEQPSLGDPRLLVFNDDIRHLLKAPSYRQNHKEDVLYIDPPYNNRQYAPNYHLYETFVKNDDPEIHGVTGLREWGDTKSAFCSKKGWEDFTLDVLKSTTAKRVYFSYSSDGLFSLEEITATLQKVGAVSVEKLAQKRYKSDESTSRVYDQSLLWEYLIEVDR